MIKIATALLAVFALSGCVVGAGTPPEAQMGTLPQPAPASYRGPPPAGAAYVPRSSTGERE